MTTKLIVRPEALEEIERATEWYENRVSGLGPEFLRAVDAATEALLRNPDQFVMVSPGLRRAQLRRFPYSLIFASASDEVIIVACAHWRRHLNRWQSRR